MVQTILSRILCTKHCLFVDVAMTVRKHEDSLFPKCASFAYWNSGPGNRTLRRRTKCFGLRFRQHKYAAKIALANVSRALMVAALSGWWVWILYENRSRLWLLKLCADMRHIPDWNATWRTETCKLSCITCRTTTIFASVTVAQNFQHDVH